MALIDRAFALTLMGLILLFSLIHLGVSIGLIVKDRKYGDFFRPQIGIASFNLVIFLFSFIASIFGIIALALNSERFARIVCIIAGVVGVFALASLVTAIVITDKTPNYIHSRFRFGQDRYSYDSGLRDRIDVLQSKYKCCGTDLWIDWANADLSGTYTNRTITQSSTTVSSTSTTITTTSTAIATTTTTTTSTTTSVLVTSSSTSEVTTTTSPTVPPSAKKKRDSHQSILYSRNKRQAVYEQGDILGLPSTFAIYLPRSCCKADAILTSNSSDAYCVSNQTNTITPFRTEGCTKPIARDAGNQAMAFIVINSFMTALSFLAIPVMLGKPSDLV